MILLWTVLSPIGEGCLLLSSPKHQSDASQHEIYARNSDAVAKRLVPCGVRCIGDVRPSVRETLQLFTLQRRQPADEQTTSDGMDGVEGAAGGSFLECTAQVAVFTGVPAVQSGHIHHEVGGILVLSCALGADHLAVLEYINFSENHTGKETNINNF